MVRRVVVAVVVLSLFTFSGAAFAKSYSKPKPKQPTCHERSCSTPTTTTTPPPPTTTTTVPSGPTGVSGPTGNTGTSGPTGNTGTTGVTPPTTTSFYVDPTTDAPQEVKTLLSQGNTTDAALIEKIASQPQADWLGSWNSNNGTVVNNELTAADGQSVLFVLFGATDLECSPGQGYANLSAYESFVNSIVSNVKGRSAWFDIEPDGLDQAGMGSGCLSVSAQEAESGYAAQQLATVSSHVYLDAGCSDCDSASGMATLLKGAGVQYATGFALDTAGFLSTTSQDAYGDQLAALLGGKHFIIDTSRNGGNTPTGDWCNPPGALLGADPTTVTNDPLDDANLWIKYPGQSDDDCGSGQPASGVWYETYAIGLTSTGTS